MRCSDSKLIGHRSDSSSPPPSPIRRLALPRCALGLRVCAWRSVACYRSGTVAGSNGIPSILRMNAKGTRLRPKSKNQVPDYRACPIRQPHRVLHEATISALAEVQRNRLRNEFSLSILRVRKSRKSSSLNWSCAWLVVS
jgi:hypothetical protein